jgi:nucleotide-binding universal stress UspA family protein
MARPGVFRRILHPTDFSRASRPAFGAAVDMAKANRADLIVVHVLPPLPLVTDAYLVATTFDEFQHRHRAAGQKELDRIVAEARAAGVPASGVLLDFGVPAELITRLARSRRVDLIAMGTHGRTGLTRAVVGSVAARVIRLAACPVLTVRGR